MLLFPDEKVKKKETHQPAGESHHGDGRLGGLRHVKQVVEQRLVLVVGEQVELVQDEQHGAAAGAITWRNHKHNQSAGEDRISPSST